MRFSEDLLARQMKPITGSAIREIFHLLNKPDMISFAGGNPAVSALEPGVIAGLAQRQLQKYDWTLLQYGGTEGFSPLRETLSDWIKAPGIEAPARCVLPTQGSQQALDLLCKALLDPGDAVLVECPTFLGALQTFNTYSAEMHALETDEDGVIPEAAEEAVKAFHPKLMYIIPTFQNPTGRTLSLPRRKKLAEIAERYGVVIAEDDPYRDLRYGGEALPAIKSFDESGWVVYLGSFSKLISPGLRVGYAVVTEERLLRKMVIGKQSVDVHSPLINQAIVDGYLREGLMPAHLQSIRQSYRAQLERMLDKLSKWPAGCKNTRPEGGLFVWAELPEKLNAKEMLDKAVKRLVAYVPGTHFYYDGGHENTLRLNFSNSNPEQIDKGMDALGKLIEEELA